MAYFGRRRRKALLTSRLQEDVERDASTETLKASVDHTFDLTNVKLEPCDDIDFVALSNAEEPQESAGTVSLQQLHNEKPVGKRGRPPSSASLADSNLLSAVLGPKPRKKWQRAKKAAGGGKFMFLEQIWALNDKQLISYFSESASNELTRNFAYTCALMPDSCAAIFTSFGSELRARASMKEHLLEHLRQLIARSKVEKDFEFMAQTVQVRKKYGTGVRGPYRKRKLKDVETTVSPKKSTYQNSETLMSINVQAVEELLSSADLANSSHISESKMEPTPCASRQLKMARNRLDAAISGQCVERLETPSSRLEFDGNSRCSDDARPAYELALPHDDHAYPFVGEPARSHMARVVDMNVDAPLTSRTSGRKYSDATEWFNGYVNSDDFDSQALSVVLRMRASRAPPVPSRLIIPIVRVPRASLVARGMCDVNMETESNGGANYEDTFDKPNGNEEVALSEVDENVPVQVPHAIPVRNRSRKVGNTSEMERKLALTYIRELRRRTKEDNPLVCKICRSKVFTAAATLLYHYRSHAGIKPFVCMICNTTFTRQHSLNYHMLIHNNLNRFTCKECGRMFRHPSHFKEHMRRHTGETPFHCTDCPLRFKTRNTYKRHLRTRHGKQLLPDGIRVMSRDEFLLTRTKPYLHEQAVIGEGEPVDELLDTGMGSESDGESVDTGDIKLEGYGGVTIVAEHN